VVEIWKDIKGFESKYQVSNLGNVRSLDRDTDRKDGRIMKLKGTLLKYRYQHSGYASICMGRKNYLVHRLVAKAFLENQYDYKVDVNHIDCDKSNNKVENLEWVSKSENIQHAINSNRFKRVYGKEHWQSKKVIQKSKDGQFVKIWESFSDIKRELKLDIKSLIYCCQNKIYKSVGGYKWQYYV
jgi:hypothetical protein